MGRVYYIFNNPSLRKKVHQRTYIGVLSDIFLIQKLKDWKLFLTALGISSVSVTLAVLQVAVPQFSPIPHVTNSAELGHLFSDVRV